MFAVHAYWQIVEHYRKHLPVIKKSEGTFKVAFIERHHKRRIENYSELLEWCNTKLQLPAGSRFKEVSCVPLNLDHADRYLQTLAEMQTVDVLVSTMLAHHMSNCHCQHYTLLPNLLLG